MIIYVYPADAISGKYGNRFKLIILSKKDGWKKLATAFESNTAI